MFNDTFDYLPLAAVVDSHHHSIQMKYFVSMVDYPLIYTQSIKSGSLIDLWKFQLKDPWETSCGQIPKTSTDGHRITEEWDGFSAQRSWISLTI